MKRLISAALGLVGFAALSAGMSTSAGAVPVHQVVSTTADTAIIHVRDWEWWRRRHDHDRWPDHDRRRWHDRDRGHDHDYDHDYDHHDGGDHEHDHDGM
jgi:hypothetical protein